MCDLIFSLQEFFKIVPGLILFPVSLYLGMKKFGTKVSASWSFGGKNTEASMITSLLLTNHKDRPLAISAIHAVLDDKYVWEVETFEQPFIVKALESIAVKPKPYSMLLLDGEIWTPKVFKPNKLRLFLVTTHKIIECKVSNSPDISGFSFREKFETTLKIRNTFNGVIYNERIVYAITYKVKSETKTALVHQSGFIAGDWDFRANKIPEKFMISAEQASSYFKEIGFAAYCESFSVDKLENKFSPQKPDH